MSVTIKTRDKLEKELFGGILKAILKTSEVNDDTSIIDGHAAMAALARVAATIITMSPEQQQADILGEVCDDICEFVEQLQKNPKWHPLRECGIGQISNNGTTQ
jgi:hypothetical protein